MNSGYRFVFCNTKIINILSFNGVFFRHMWRYLAHVKHLFSALKTQMHQIKVGDICATQWVENLSDIIIFTGN